MGIFIDYKSNPFNNLNNTPQTIVETTANTLWVQSIIITNLGESDIRINLKFVRATTPSVPEIFLTKDFLIPAATNPREYRDRTLFNTVDLVEVLGIKKNLQYGVGLTESLVCYSNGYSQVFDCCVDYSSLNESV